MRRGPTPDLLPGAGPLWKEHFKNVWLGRRVVREREDGTTERGVVCNTLRLPLNNLTIPDPAKLTYWVSHCPASTGGASGPCT